MRDLLLVFVTFAQTQKVVSSLTCMNENSLVGNALLKIEERIGVYNHASPALVLRTDISPMVVVLRSCGGLAAPLLLTLAMAATGATASEFNQFAAAPNDLVAIDASRPDLIIELGLGAGAKPAYEGASDYALALIPIVRVERLNIPGLIDIGGQPQNAGFKLAPSFSFQGERKSADHAALTGLDNVDMTIGLGARVGYEFVITPDVSAEVYGAARYTFGGAEGVVGEAGVDITARLSPQLEIVAGPMVSFASDGYMDTYFGVGSAESAATGGRLAAYDPEGGLKSAGVNLSARYEFVPDTFLNLDASYERYLGDAESSPIVRAGQADQFTIGLGLSRRFTANY